MYAIMLYIIYIMHTSYYLRRTWLVIKFNAVDITLIMHDGRDVYDQHFIIHDIIIYNIQTYIYNILGYILIGVYCVAYNNIICHVSI